MTIVYFLVKFEPTTGKSKHILEVSRRLVKRGVTVHLITNAVRWSGPPEALQHLKIHEIGGGTNRAYLKTRALASLVQRLQPDVFELHGGLSMTIFARSFARSVGQPTVVNIHSQPSDLLREWWHLKIGDWIHDRRYVADFDDVIGFILKTLGPARFVDHPNIKAVLVPSRQLERAYNGDPRVRYLPSGAELPTGIPDRSLPEAVPTLLFFGRAVMVRGIDTLIEAFQEIADEYESLHLQLLLLDDLDTRRIENLRKRSPQADRIDIRIGRQGQMSDFFSQAMIAVFPFRSSGCIPEQPLTLIEAMASGLPCITCPVGTVGEIVRDGENGLLVAPNQPHELAQAIRRLLDQPELRARIAVKGRENVNDRFNWDTLAEQTFHLYEQIAESR